MEPHMKQDHLLWKHIRVESSESYQSVIKWRAILGFITSFQIAIQVIKQSEISHKTIDRYPHIL